MNKKILFLRASSGWKDPSPPMAFSYLGAIAKKQGFGVSVENLNAIYNKTDMNSLIMILKKEKPIVGISIFTNYAKDSYELIKKIRPFCEIIIAGGPHVTIYPEEALKEGIDIAFIGEAEESFEEFLKIINKKGEIHSIKGIAYKKDGLIFRNENLKVIDLNELPIPDREVHKKSSYIKTPEEINNFGGILTSRGCPGKCTYCYHSLFGRGFRYRSAKNVFEEIVYLHREYGIKHINFIDDAFTINKKRLDELLDLLIQSKLSIEWVCATRIDFLDREMLFKMKKAGCAMISLGIESIIPETLFKIKKTSNPDWYIKHSKDVLKWCKISGIRAGVNILTGFPWDSVEDIKQLQEYVKDIFPYVTQSFCGGILQPLPNTEIYDEYAKEYGFEKWWLYKEPLFKGDYHPFFMLHYHPFYEQLYNNFFRLDKKVFYEIDKLYKMMGKWNLQVIVKRRFKNKTKSFTIYQVLFLLSLFSFIIYRVSQRLERLLMNSIEIFSYKYKFKR